MNEGVRARAIAAVIATIVCVGGIFAYIGHRESLAGGVAERLLDHGEKNSMIASTTEGPAETRFDVFWRCDGAPGNVRTVYAEDEKTALRDVERLKKPCAAVRAVPTDRPYCNAERICGFDRPAGP